MNDCRRITLTHGQCQNVCWYQSDADVAVIAWFCFLASSALYFECRANFINAMQNYIFDAIAIREFCVW